MPQRRERARRWWLLSLLLAAAALQAQTLVLEKTADLNFGTLVAGERGGRFI